MLVHQQAAKGNDHRKLWCRDVVHSGQGVNRACTELHPEYAYLVTVWSREQVEHRRGIWVRTDPPCCDGLLLHVAAMGAGSFPPPLSLWGDTRQASCDILLSADDIPCDDGVAGTGLINRPCHDDGSFRTLSFLGIAIHHTLLAPTLRAHPARLPGR